MFINKLISLIFLLLTIKTNSYALICSDYGDFKLFNGHYYTVTTKRVDFNTAKQLAEANGGYLAIPDTAQENTFITSLIKGGQYAWIGIYDPNFTANYCYSGSNCVYDDKRFKTVKNAALSYRNWASTQPDNLVKSYDIVNGKQMVSPLGENWVAIGSPSGQWADQGNHADEYNNPVKNYAVYEFDTMPECYTNPSTVSDEIIGKKCQTQIYDTNVGILSNGQALDCQKDIYGNDYCPSALSQCGQQWDYENGYSISGVGQATDYTSKITYTQNVDVNYYLNLTGDPANLSCSDIAKIVLISNHYYVPGNYISWDETVVNTMNNDIVQINGQDYKVTYAYYVGDTGSYSSAFAANIQNVATGQTYSYPTSHFYPQGNNGTRYSHHVLSYNQTSTTITATITPTPYKNRWCMTSATITLAKKELQTFTKCPDGYTETSGAETAYGQCKRVQQYTYYNYLCNNSPNAQGQNFTPTTTGGNTGKSDPNGTIQNDLSAPLNSSTPPTNNCKRLKFTCLANADRPCSYVNNQWQCSPFPCFSGNDIENTDTQVGLTDANNNGWSNNGNCNGKIYIFNGQDNRCRSDDAFFGLTGGGCCDKDKVFLGVISCKDDEKKLAKLNNQSRCHYVGEYCSKKIKFIGCVQHKKSYCCFNSKLARIINEQGRVQLSKGWGGANSPDCKGFTPEEFQKLDFSKIDMSEFFGDLQKNFNVNFVQNQQNFIQSRITNNMNNLSGK